ncbi:ABC transporter permease subunit [Mycoplasma sp. NEAQ87857]|uniref:ABC transporter permease subunit n=1 Tax=Mycoplasma sp. NEAQ87857 TaxID=2683967 RepID=UPI001317877D|nr:ABC transporter permease subunit [Mycoplasma sp. NEAQ87857]QGZ97229.1 ABC transporter permease subunit [Mycoplasma sp. NEAQ87857]
MDKLKLYNWYGESFDPVLPESSSNLKSYKHQVDNVFTRLKDNLKINISIEKDLYLRARTKIQDNLKRELASHLVAYKNKIKVFKDSIKKLDFVDSDKKIIKYELSKLKKDKQNTKQYIKDYIYSLEKSADDYQDKVNNLQKIYKSTSLSENITFHKYCILSTILIYINKFNDRDFDLNKINKDLLPIEKEILSQLDNPSQYLKDFFDKLEKQRIHLLNKRNELLEKYQKTEQLQYELYEKERKNIILNANKRINELEFEFNQKIEAARIKSYEYKQEALTKINAHKQEIIAADQANKDKIQAIKNHAKAQQTKLKLVYKQNIKKQNLIFTLRVFKDLSRFLENHNIPHQKVVFDYKKLNEEQLIKEIQAQKQYFANLTVDDQRKNLLLKIAVKNYLSSSNIKSSKKGGLTLLKSQYQELLANTYKGYSYEYLFKEEYSKALKDRFVDDYKTRIKFLKEKVIALYELETLKLDNVLIKEKQENKEQFALIDKQYKEDLKEAKNRIKNKEISKQAFKNKKIELKIKLKESKYEIKLQSSFLKNKDILRSHFLRKRAENKINKKIYESKINEAQKTIPVECVKHLKWYAPLLSLILPGLPEVIWFKQYLKGSIMLFVSLLCWSLVVPFSFGAYWNKIDGIQGLFTLGHDKFDAVNGVFIDARYYLFGGVVSIIFMTLLLIYFLVSAIGSYRVAKFLQQGTRPSRWSHTKRWLNTSGFPWMISLVGWFLMIFIVAAPVVTSILISFTNLGYLHNGSTQTVDWVGLEQWGKWWQFRDLNLIGSIANVFSWTIIWTIASTILPICLGIIIAVLTNNNRLKGKKIFRLIFILPWAIPAFVTLSFIKNMFVAGDVGIVNFLLKNILGIPGRAWLNEITTARILVIIVQTWIAYAWIFMLVTGNLQSIPKDIYEAGSVDGAKGKHLFAYLTLPSLLLGIAPMLIGQFVGAFNNFTTISIFTGGGPAFPYTTPFNEGATDIIISWVYKLTTGGVQIVGNLAFSAALTTIASLFSIGLAARGFIKSMSRKD